MISFKSLTESYEVIMNSKLKQQLKICKQKDHKIQQLGIKHHDTTIGLTGNMIRYVSRKCLFLWFLLFNCLISMLVFVHCIGTIILLSILALMPPKVTINDSPVKHANCHEEICLHELSAFMLGCTWRNE